MLVCLGSAFGKFRLVGEEHATTAQTVKGIKRQRCSKLVSYQASHTKARKRIFFKPHPFLAGGAGCRPRAGPFAGVRRRSRRFPPARSPSYFPPRRQVYHVAYGPKSHRLDIRSCKEPYKRRQQETEKRIEEKKETRTYGKACFDRFAKRVACLELVILFLVICTKPRSSPIFSAKFVVALPSPQNNRHTRSCRRLDRAASDGQLPSWCKCCHSLGIWHRCYKCRAATDLDCRSTRTRTNLFS